MAHLESQIVKRKSFPKVKGAKMPTVKQPIARREVVLAFQLRIEEQVWPGKGDAAQRLRVFRDEVTLGSH